MCELCVSDRMREIPCVFVCLNVILWIECVKSRVCLFVCLFECVKFCACLLFLVLVPLLYCVFLAIYSWLYVIQCACYTCDMYMCVCEWSTLAWYVILYVKYESISVIFKNKKSFTVLRFQVFTCDYNSW